MATCTILLNTKTRDMIRYYARKEQTYDRFIVELINSKFGPELTQNYGNVGVKVENNPGPESPSKTRIIVGGM